MKLNTLFPTSNLPYDPAVGRAVNKWLTPESKPATTGSGLNRLVKFAVAAAGGLLIGYVIREAYPYLRNLWQAKKPSQEEPASLAAQYKLPLPNGNGEKKKQGIVENWRE